MLLCDIVSYLVRNNMLHRLYRFQNDSEFSNYQMSIKRFDIDLEGSLNFSSSNGLKLRYVYFSKSFEHHKYFIYLKLTKCIKNIIKENLIKDFNYIQLMNDNIVNKMIFNFIEENKDFFKFNSIRLLFTDRFAKLLNESAVISQIENVKDRLYLELNDINKFDGVYAVSIPWLNLTTNISLIYETGKINFSDILLFLELMKFNMEVRRDGYKKESVDPTPFIKESMNLITNKNIYSDSNIININNDIDKLIRTKLYLPNSPFDKAPQSERKLLIEEYEQIKEFILKNLNNSLNLSLNIKS